MYPAWFAALVAWPRGGRGVRTNFFARLSRETASFRSSQLPRQPGTTPTHDAGAGAPTHDAGAGTPTDHGFVDRDEHDGSGDSDEKRNPSDSTIGIVVPELASHR